MQILTVYQRDVEDAIPYINGIRHNHVGSNFFTIHSYILLREAVPYIVKFTEQAQRKQLLHSSLLLITSPLAVPYIVKFTEQAQRKQHRIII